MHHLANIKADPIYEPTAGLQERTRHMSPAALTQTPHPSPQGFSVAFFPNFSPLPSGLLGWGLGELELTQKSSSVCSGGRHGEDRVMRNLVSCTSRVPHRVSPKHSLQLLGVGFEIAHEHITTKMRYTFPKCSSAFPVWGYPPLHQQQTFCLLGWDGGGER